MNYVALLRGINVGGKHKIEMKKLKDIFESLGYENVSTYINSGNVLFKGKGSSLKIRQELEVLLKQKFGFDIPTLVKTEKEIMAITKAIPQTWKNNDTKRTDVAFLFPGYDPKNIIDEIPVKKEFIDIRYVTGALFWNVSRENVYKSQLNKLISHKLYKFMTVRNINTVRVLGRTIGYND
jgi:uncharacterized protein (DUF1697 family)